MAREASSRRRSIDVGFEPNGLTVADLNGNGKADLLVSNPLGDVLVLIGNGDGTFQPVQNLDQQVALAVYAPNGTTPAAFIFADQLTDQLVVQTVGGVTTVLGDASTGLISPGAVTLADLNNNGILDLIVANSGSNNVLVYPGLGNGTFGPALNDGHGFFTGTNPVGITVADVTGDGRPDLIIANEGSNDVSILINVKVGNSFTFVPGPRLQAGVGPVATVVADVLGNGVPDLVDRQQRLEQRLAAPGASATASSTTRSRRSIPWAPTRAQLFVGQFTAGSGQDLVTVNSGSNNLTLISGLGPASPLMQSISSGGIDPTAAFAVDLTGNGLDSLVVANNGDGNIALFQAGDNGLALSSVLSSSGLPNPSGLALASFSGGNLEFYATTEGEASASLLGFQLEESGGIIRSFAQRGRGLGPTPLPERDVAGLGRHSLDAHARIARRERAIVRGRDRPGRVGRAGRGRPEPARAESHPGRVRRAGRHLGAARGQSRRPRCPGLDTSSAWIKRSRPFATRRTTPAPGATTGEGRRARHNPPRAGWRCPTDRPGHVPGTGRIGGESPIRGQT